MAEDYGTKDSLIVEVRERYSHAQAEWKAIRDEGKKDMRYVSGDPWDEADRRKRQNAGRPCLVVDELNQYFNQAINGVRANPRAVKFAPVGGGANERGADFYADKMREIEYRSHAQIAYITAFENAIQRGYGFVRINTKFSTVQGQRFNQDIWIDDVPNPDLVWPDPEAKRPDSSDMQYCYIAESWTQAEFTRKFPKAKYQSFTADAMKEAPGWVKDNSVTLAEYWKVKSTSRKLLLVQPPPPLPQMMPAGTIGLQQPQQQPSRPVEIWEDEFTPGSGQVLKTEDREDQSVCQYLTNGLEILEEKDWPGKYIPIVSCYGKVLYVDSGGGAKRVLLSMTRLARDPYMLYCYYRTTQAELVGMTPKTPYMAYKGQLDANQLENLKKSLHEPVAVIEANATTEHTAPGQVLPLPMRQPYKPEIDLLEIGAEGARRAIQSAMATNFMPTQAQRRNEKSGKALEKIEEAGQRGSFHFNDHHDDMIRQVGVIVEDLLDKIIDNHREVSVRKKNDDAQTVWVNGPAKDKKKQPDEIATKGEYQVTVSTGPAFDSTREMVGEFADLLMETPFAPRIADLAVRLKSGSTGSDVTLEEIADRLTPPEFRKPKDGEGPDPAQLMQMVAQQQQENQNLKQILTEISMTLKTKQLEIESAEKIAKAEIESKERIAHSKDATAVMTTGMKLGSSEHIASMQAELERIKAIIEGREADMNRQFAGAEAERGRQHEGEQNERSRAHEAARARQDHGHKLEEGAQSLKGDLVKGEQGNVHALEQGQEGHKQTIQQIQATPRPTNGAAR